MQPHSIKIFPAGLQRHSIFKNADLTGEVDRPSSSYSLANDQEDTVYRLNSSFKSNGQVSRQISDQQVHSGLDKITKKVNPTFAKISYDSQLVDYI